MLGNPHTANLLHDRLIAAAKEGLSVNLTTPEVFAVVQRWIELIEAKNQVVQDNHKLLDIITKQEQA